MRLAVRFRRMSIGEGAWELGSGRDGAGADGASWGKIVATAPPRGTIAAGVAADAPGGVHLAKTGRNTSLSRKDNTMNTLPLRNAVLLAILGLPPAAAAEPDAKTNLPAAQPEEVGMSSERLSRIHAALQRHIDAHQLAGAVTLIARKGKVVHFQTHGWADLDSKRPMSPDALFRMASTTKPVTAVAVLMLLEQGKLRLTDPISRFIPEFKDTKVAVAKTGSEEIEWHRSQAWNHVGQRIGRLPRLSQLGRLSRAGPATPQARGVR